MKLKRQKEAKINKSLQIVVKSLIFFSNGNEAFIYFFNNLIKETTKLKKQSITKRAKCPSVPVPVAALLSILSQEACNYQPLSSTLVLCHKRCFPEQRYCYTLYKME